MIVIPVFMLDQASNESSLNVKNDSLITTLEKASSFTGTVLLTVLQQLHTLKGRYMLRLHAKLSSIVRVMFLWEVWSNFNTALASVTLQEQKKKSKILAPLADIH